MYVKLRWGLAALVGAVFMLGGCAMRQDINSYAANEPKFNLEHVFAGQTTAHGVLADWKGTITRRFTAEIKGTFKGQGVGQTGTLDEVFVFDDGERQTRVWQLVRTGENTWDATAGDVIGVAKGVQAGNAFNLRYVLAVPYQGRTLHLTMDDWMYLLPDGTVMNLTSLNKFGLKVGQLSLLIQAKK